MLKGLLNLTAEDMLKIANRDTSEDYAFEAIMAHILQFASIGMTEFYLGELQEMPTEAEASRLTKLGFKVDLHNELVTWDQEEDDE